MAGIPHFKIRYHRIRQEAPNRVFASSGLLLVVAYLIGASSHYSRLDQIKAANLNSTSESTLVMGDTTSAMSVQSLHEDTGSFVASSLNQFFTNPASHTASQNPPQNSSETTVTTHSSLESVPSSTQQKNISMVSFKPTASAKTISQKTIQTNQDKPTLTATPDKTETAPQAKKLQNPSTYRPPVPLAASALSEVPVSSNAIERVQTMRREFKQGKVAPSPRLREVRQRISGLQNDLEGTAEARQVRQELQEIRNTIASQSAQ